MANIDAEILALISAARKRFHERLLQTLLTVDPESGVPSIADKGNRLSEAISRGIVEQLGAAKKVMKGAGQSAGTGFEAQCATFISETFLKLKHLRPGRWVVRKKRGDDPGSGVILLAEFEQYRHLDDLKKAVENNRALAAFLGNDYTITPDVIVARETESDDAINQPEAIVDDRSALHATLRAKNGGSTILHASISCKWTTRSDRAQNSRTEALNLIRNRKGRLPHVVVVTAEPTPSRISSIALGTGDIDCTYHFALPELQNAIPKGSQDARDLLETMIEGKRLRDISDLPLDLAV